MQKIKSMNWRGDIPLGPLGQYVKARDPKTWGEILRSQLGQYLTAFAITNAADRACLKKLLVESGNAHILIVIYEKDNFDYRHGEPPEHILTVLRALDISDPYVLRILINQARIESQILAPTRREGEASLRTLRGGSAWTLDKFAVRVYPEGGVSTQPLNVRQLSGATNLLLTGRDTAADVRHFVEEKVKFEAEWSTLSSEVAQKKAAFLRLKQRLDQFNDDERRVQHEQAAAKRVMNQLINEANDELPAGLAGLEGAKEEATQEMEGIMRQAEEVFRQKSDLDNSQREVQNQINGINERLRAFENIRHEKQKTVEAAVETRMQAQNQKKYYEEKLQSEQAKVNAAEEIAKVLEEEFSNWTAKAAEFCEQVLNPRKTAEVQRQLESVQNALKEREKRQGASVEDMAREFNKAKEAYERADQEVRQMISLNKALRKSIVTRISRWHEFRRHIALRCKHVFQFHLSHRGYYGKIIFDHQAGSLQLRVQTDDQLQTQGQKDKDPRALSGGEKSFSTICLLLSLWESIGCPIRCLDEFDVFMDAINRRISMSMMIETANTSDKKQYVLITPQDMTNVVMGSTVKVHRMMDPERGNGMLPFGASGA
ncbi:hypothetical protein CPB83DRAFT_690784 [Crepidotus variabilis]|uniref:Structural maintenance of chromosomes protein 6 n=1 Tax=Crepidotus variabilis TaxID=179855 RepID=A0A9P6JJX4_9AGAR|nr:hypothetical protein CPB83DRAFT_690784 [Crepidotus variabilis]